MMKIKEVAKSAIEVFLPRHCPVCGQALDRDEEYLCRQCLLHIPRTHFEGIPFNAMEQHFAGKIPIERAAAYFFYERRDPYASILHDIKYHNMPQMGRWISRLAARQMAPSGLWQGVDYLIPVPLHATKQAKRGYNQSDYLAQGVSDYTGIPIYEAIAARKPHATQTHKSAHERYLNAQGLYAPIAEARQELQGKHVMIVDDVATTGATLLTCAESIASIPGIKISLFTLAAARLQ